MKIFIITFLFFLFYFITIKDIYDSNKYLTEDVRLIERELGERDSIIIKLRYENSKLNQKITELNKIKKPKKRLFVPIIKKEESKPVEEKITQNDTLF